jgi:hypothetical protein
MNVMPLVETTIDWSTEKTPMGKLAIKSMNLDAIMEKKDHERIFDTIYDAIQKKGYKPVKLTIGITCRMIEQVEEEE